MLIDVTHKPSAPQNPATSVPSPRATTRGRVAPVVHALGYLLFGLVTVFVQAPTWGTVKLLVGAFLLVVGASQWLGARALTGSSAGSVFRSVALVQAAAAALLVVQPDEPARIVLIICAGVGLGELMKTLVGVRFRAGLTAARDWLLEGAVMLAAAVCVPLVAGIGAKAVLGVTGGGALVVGVFLLVAALGSRDEAATADA